MEKKRQVRDEERQGKREYAVSLLKSNQPVQVVSKTTGVPRTTCSRLNIALKEEDNTALQRLLSPSCNRAGRQPVITIAESQLIKEQIRHASVRGFAMDDNQLRVIFAKIANDGRKCFKTENGLPSMDVIRRWRAHNRDVTHRKAEHKNSAKLHAEGSSHIETLKSAFQTISTANPGIFDDASRLWNVDETEISAENGQVVKVYSCASSHHGGARSQSFSGRSRHVTAVVAVSASGEKTPPFIVVEGKNVMSNWFDPFSFEEASNNPAFWWLTDKDWFPTKAVVMCTDNGSMEMRIIKHLIVHIDKHVRKFVEKGKSYCLTLDGHSSRNGYAWLEYSKKVGCEVVQLPSDTSHILQPCDRHVNRELKKAVRMYRDELCKLHFFNLNSIRAKLILSIVGYKSVTSIHIIKSFTECGLWPMKFQFMELANDQHEQAFKSEQTDGQRLSDSDVLHKLRKIMDSNEHPSNILMKITTILQQHESVYNIVSKPCELHEHPSSSDNKEATREILQKGTPAMCLTLGDIIETRKKAVQEKKAAEILKKKKKAEKEAARETKRALRSITGSYRGEKKQKTVAVEGLLALGVGEES